MQVEVRKSGVGAPRCLECGSTELVVVAGNGTPLVRSLEAVFASESAAVEHNLLALLDSRTAELERDVRAAVARVVREAVDDFRKELRSTFRVEADAVGEAAVEALGDPPHWARPIVRRWHARIEAKVTQAVDELRAQTRL